MHSPKARHIHVWVCSRIVAEVGPIVEKGLTVGVKASFDRHLVSRVFDTLLKTGDIGLIFLVFHRGHGWRIL
jgi:hypothetical protein